MHQTSKYTLLTLLTLMIMGGGVLIAPTSAEAGFFSWIKSFFVSEDATFEQEAAVHQAAPDVSQDPDEQIKLLTEEQRQKQRQAQAEVESLKQELAEVQAQIEAVEDDDGNTAPPAPSIQDTSLDSLKELETKLLSRIEEVEDLARKLAKANFRAISLTGKIDNLSGVTLNDAEITGTLTGLTDAHIPNDITASNYLPTSGGTLTGSITGTNATFSGTLSVSASTTFNGVEYLFPSADGTNTQVLTTDGAGGLSWTTISSGSTSSWEAFNNSGIRLATTSHQVLIGGSSTSSTAALEVSGQSYFSDNVGLGDTTPSYALTVSGDSQVSGLVDADHFVATSTTATSTFNGGVKLNKSGTGIEFQDGTIQKTMASNFVYNSISTSGDGATGQIDAGSHFDVAADTGAITRTLKTADITTAGNRWRFKLTDASNKLTIDTEGSETIGVDGDSSLTLGIQGQVVELMSDGTNVQIVRLNPLNQILIVDEKTDGTAGGSSSAGDNTRVLNTEKQDSGNNASLASNQVTLNAGTYQVIEISAPAVRADRHTIKLLNVTDTADIALGTSEYSSTADGRTHTQSRSFIRAGTIFTIAASKALEVEHYIQTAQASNGLGIENSNGDVETYAVFAVERIQ